MELDVDMDYSIQCPQCQIEIHSSIFQEHYNNCMGDEDQNQNQQQTDNILSQLKDSSNNNNPSNNSPPNNVIGGFLNILLNIGNEIGEAINNNINPTDNASDDGDENYEQPYDADYNPNNKTTTTTSNNDDDDHYEQPYDADYNPNTTYNNKTTTTTTTTSPSYINHNNNNNNNYNNKHNDRYSIINVDEGDCESMDGASDFVLMSNGEEDDEYRSIQLAHQLLEQERLEKLAREEEENQRLVIEMLERERLQHEQSIKESSKDLVTQCIKCLKNDTKIEDIIFLDCSHVYCKSCLYSFIMNKINKKKVSSIICKSCKNGKHETHTLSSTDIKQVLNDQEYATYADASLHEVISQKNNIYKCPSCNYIMEKIIYYREDKIGKEYDENGNELSKEAIDHKNKFRLRCPSCSTAFCTDCFSNPYHLGYTCEQFKIYSQSSHCRFCQTAIRSNTQLCQSEECQARAKKVCTKKLSCGHICHGIADEKTCLPCLEPECKKSNQTSDDYCNICWTEDLAAAPCIQLECGHIFHFECCQKKLVNKWNSSRISFGFMKCALCSTYIKHSALKEELDPILELYDKIKTKGIQRLQAFGPEKGVNLKDPNCKWYNNEELYVMERLSYFPCFKCKRPYFGGEKACGENNVDFKPEELLCGGCSCDGNDNCKKHGKDYIEYKCKFCCNMSVFFCWGKTHFCDDCHKKSTEMVKTPRNQLPKCTCGVAHPPNGEEHCYGCSLCRIATE